MILHRLLKYCLLGVACLLSLPAIVAQSNLSVINSLQGKWVLDEVYIHEINDTLSIDPAGVSEIEIYPQLDIVDDVLFFSYKGTTLERKYKVAGELLLLSFYETAFYVKWKISDNKLHLRWGQDIAGASDNEVLLLSIALTYRRE